MSITRSELIGQLRHALAEATSPSNDVVSFDIGDTSFEYEFEDNWKCSSCKNGR